ncbi:hypothetical protein [Sciscionella marina]|uniref:hypothetical protein n=1 Tax=Sciscionella marina TaxID=508770 RepID=UPI000376CB38|nr:hypothetical protein [Sciscionella marina]
MQLLVTMSMAAALLVSGSGAVIGALALRVGRARHQQRRPRIPDSRAQMRVRETRCREGTPVESTMPLPLIADEPPDHHPVRPDPTS